MQIIQNPANMTSTTSAVPAPAPAKDSASQLISSDFSTFLRLLTTQMKNQDPLDPVKTDQFATQLATFSGVEQQVRSNDLLSRIADQMGLSDISSFADWIGKEARAVMPVEFNGAPIDIHPDFAPDADKANLVVRDSAGAVVQTQPLSLASGPVHWTGTTQTGAPLPVGLYSFEVVSFKGGALLDTRPAEVYAKVREARIVGGQPVLIFDGDASVATDAVSGLRQPHV